MVRPPQAIIIRRYLTWQLRDARTRKTVSRKHLNVLAENGEKFAVIDANTIEYIARSALGQMVSRQKTERKPSERLPLSTGFHGLIIKRYLSWRLYDTRIGKYVSRKRVSILAKNGENVVVVDSTTNERTARLALDALAKTQGGTPAVNLLDERARPNILLRWQLIQPYLERRQRFAWAAAEATATGYGGNVLLSQMTGIPVITINQWKRRLRNTKHATAGSLVYDARHWKVGPSIEARDPEIIPALERILAEETAGDPMGRQKWARCTTRSLSERLMEQGHRISYKTVRKLGYSLRSIKKRHAGVRYPRSNEQFEYISTLKAQFLSNELPVISIDTKKKELIGNYQRPGKTWRKTPIEADDFYPSSRKCLAVPFGIYDLARNSGYVTVGISSSTSEFAINCLSLWWRRHGRREYPNADRLLILADGGGSNNGPKVRAWKSDLQTHLCDTFGLTVTVTHYPPGCSKYKSHRTSAL
jgi:polyhydroxyalkanoate synthesis regulator protein